MDLKNVTFSGKTGIVTGGARGIGRAIAEQFAAMGGKVILVYHNSTYRLKMI